MNSKELLALFIEKANIEQYGVTPMGLESGLAAVKDAIWMAYVKEVNLLHTETSKTVLTRKYEQMWRAFANLTNKKHQTSVDPDGWKILMGQRSDHYYRMFYSSQRH